ncbi:flagellar hook-length control protein FliK [Roseibium sp.]|uniref:flagellar hook-length control protein FliK n=1 Tax=Roseibium sp. TaxID=1936156 RepID=UPI003A969C88
MSGAQGQSTAERVQSQVTGRLVASYPQASGYSAATSPVASATTSGARTPVSQQLVDAAAQLRPALDAQQSSLSGVFSQVQTVSAAAAAGTITVSEPVKQVMQQILGLRLGGSSAPSAGDIGAAVRSSGVFAEAGQAAGKADSEDLKMLLGQLKGLLAGLGVKAQIPRPMVQPPVPNLHAGPRGQAQSRSSSASEGAAKALNAQELLGKLMQDTDSALARIRLTQMVNRGLGDDDGPVSRASQGRAMDLVMELPIAVGQETAVMQMQVGRDPDHDTGEGDEGRAWRLRFGMDLTATGPFEAAISLRGGGTFVSLWIEREETYQGLGGQRETIEAAFADAGLDLQELRFIRGLPMRVQASAGAKVDRQS